MADLSSLFVQKLILLCDRVCIIGTTLPVGVVAVNSYYSVGKKIPGILSGKVGILVCLILFLSIYPVTAQELGRETLITVQSSSVPSSPAIYGDTIVWTDALACFPDGYAGCVDIYRYNVQSGEEIPLAVEGDTTDHEAPSISGEYVAYQAFDAVDFYTYDIHLYHAGEVTDLTEGTPDTNQMFPTVGGHWAAWKDDTDGCAVILYDIDQAANTSYQPLVIDSNTESCYLEANSPPSLSNDRVVWEAMKDSSYDIYLYDIGEETIYNITNNTPDSNQMYPEISGNYVIWQDDRNGNWDIAIADISNLSDIQVTLISRDSDQVNPSIDAGMVVWEGKEDTGSQLYLLNLADSPGEAQMISDGINNHYNPKISGNRVVYEKSIDGDTEIYLFTYGETAACPVASFSTSTPHSSSTAPFTVDFIDASEPAPEVWIWDFGDGITSTEANPNHTYATIGVYNVTLTVSTPACRNATTAQNYVSIGRIPVVNFIGAPLCGRMPLTVSFTDRSSGNPTDWAWDFEDDSIVDSTEQHPSFEYTEGGSFSVNLTAVNSVGSDSLLREGYISVMSQGDTTVDTAIDGLVFENNGDIQRVSINLTMIEVTSDENSVTFSPTDESGISEITLFSDASGFTVNGDLMGGNVTGVLLTSENILLDEFSEYPCSNCYFNFTLEAPEYPVEATISSYSWEGAVPCDRGDIRRTVSETQFDHVESSAYEVQLVTSNLGTISNLTLFFAVNSSWVTDRNKVWVVRLGDDDVGQVLPTTYVYTDPESNFDVFTTFSPRGPSKFTLSTLSRTGNPLQIVILTAQQWFDGGDGGDSYGGGTIATTTITRAPTPAASVPATLPEPVTSPAPETPEQATIEAPIPTPTLPVIESPPIPVSTTTTPLPPFITTIALVAAAGVLWLVKRRK